MAHLWFADLMKGQNAQQARHIEIVDAVEPGLALFEPVRQTAAAVIGVPHAGRRYPRRFVEQSRLSLNGLRRSEDAYVDLLCDMAPELGAPLLAAHFPRAYLDVNREPYELDPRMFEGRLPPFANTRSMRVAGGLGAIPRVVGDGHEIYARKLPAAEALRRIEAHHRPYHEALKALLGRTRLRFGYCVLVDMHSMPSVGLEREGAGRPDIILGDRFGTSAAGWIVDAAEEALRSEGFDVRRNRPYAGGYITEHYGQPRSDVHALQIEINRALYMDEATIQPRAIFDQVRAALGASLADMLERWTEGGAMPLAAE